MTFENAIEDWESHDDWRYADRDAERKFFYLAGQASAEQRVKELNTLCEFNEKTMEDLLAKNAELERERDQWKYTAEIRQQHLEYTIKAQAGEPDGWIDGGGKLQELNPDGFEDWQPLYTHPKPVKAQAGEPVGYHFSYTTPFGHVVWDIDYTPRPDAIECYPLVRAHPTTERPYNAKVTGSPALSASPSGLPGYATEVEK